MPDLDEFLGIATGAARAAGVALRARFGAAQAGVGTKTTATDMVSDADRASEALIVEQIRAARPDDAILGEETGARAGTSGVRWVIDPLDGTTNYLYGIPHWAVSIAAEDGEGVVAAAVYDVSRDELFAAARGRGATCNGAPIAVSPADDMARALVATGFSYRAEEREAAARLLPTVLPSVRDIRRAGAAALDLAWVACGRLDGYFESPIEWWDMAAGTLLVTEAGGRCGDLPPLGADEGQGYIAAGPGIYEDLLALVTRAIDG